MIELAVLARLNEITALTALVGTRIYQLKVPQKATMPCVRVQLIDESEDYHLRGGSAVRHGRVQIDAFAAESTGGDPYAAAVAVAEAIHGGYLDGMVTGLSAFRGDVGGSPATHEIDGAFRIGTPVTYEPDEFRLVRSRQDYLILARSLT